MTGLLIFLGIVLLILGILMIPVHASVDYKEELLVKIRFLFFFRIQLIPEKEGKKKEEKPKKEKTVEEKTPEEKPQKLKKKKTPEEIVDFIVDTVNKYGPGVKMILHNIRFHRLELYWKIGGDDAAEIGIKYGRVCAWLSGILGFFRNLMRIEKAKFRVFPDFISPKDEMYGGADIEFNPLVILIGALRMGIVFLKDMLKNNRKSAKKMQKNINAKENC